MELMQAGVLTAQKAAITGTATGRGLARQIGRSLQKVEDRWRALGRLPREEAAPAAEWLLDNGWLARREGTFAREELGRAKALRQCRKGLYLQALSAAFLDLSPRLDPGDLTLFLDGVQRTRPLTEAELALLPSALRGELCRRLGELCADRGADWTGEALAGALEDLFTALRTLNGPEVGHLLRWSSPVEQILVRDPAGVYGAMDAPTRYRYRRQVCALAKQGRMTETEAARRALNLAQQGTGEEGHIGHFLFSRPLGREVRRSSGRAYVAAVLAPALLLSLYLGFLLDHRALSLLLLLPISDLCKNLVDFLAVRIFPPRPIHRLKLKNGIPSEGKTLCVIAGLLTGPDSGAEYARLLERYCLANRDSGEALSFGLLADLPDRPAPMGKREEEWVRNARSALDALNGAYGGRFYLLFRRPTFQHRDEHYGGWERKRGALLELTRLLRGEPSGLQVLAGDKKGLPGTRFVITLDSDTALNVGTAREMVGAMLHPLNRPVVDPRRRVVTRGYGLLQPRIGVDLSAANRSQFSRIFAGLGGIDPYGGACSDVYHDLFDRGSYTGKGIFDVEAFSACLDGRFPQGRILSHDLLEGAYLHAGLLEDVELTDGYPYRLAAYFARQHRWVRGDWQLLPWLGRRVPNEAGERVENPITALDKWKLFDNLRRSLSPVATLLSLLLGMCLSTPAFGVAAALAIVAAWSNLLLTGADLAFRGGVGLRRRYHATVIAGFAGMLLQTLVQLIFLPYQAWVCASAISAALWRSLVSRKKLLEWVTAADAERKKGTLRADFAAQWPAVAVGLFALLFSRIPAGAAVGMVWAVSPLFSWALSRPIRTREGAREADRPFLLHQAGLIWDYFRDWLGPEDHWLPPDNVQLKPWLGPARRTSPTNIGMALLSCVAAVDLGLADRGRAAELVAHMVDTLEGLEKWKGHLYNWYDTADAAPLRPRYVSTVDSGNLKGCLIALREALLEWGEGELAQRAEALARAMDLSALYDRERGLFSIGCDPEKGAWTPGWYDLMASEARLTSYVAVALGEVEPRHWRRLGRALVGENNYCGMASWTGTMFEYFMPQLLLPCEPGSLMYESLSYCIYAQKRRSWRTRTPWGVSESGFYAFDPAQAYQYKAHGVQALGLRRDLDRETVVAPYASFLALLLAPDSAANNLRRLRDMGLEGQYGLYEAVDFTPGRVPAGEKWAGVCSFMAHHQGMSLVAIDNALKGGVMQRRFLKNRSMAAFRELLQEKVPVGEPIMKVIRQGEREGPQLPRLQEQYCWEEEGCDPARVACHLLSNGLVSALCTDAGAVRLTDDRGESPLVTYLQENCAPAGVSFFYRDGAGGLHGLTQAPLGAGWTGRWAFSADGACWETRGADFSARVDLRLPKGERGALWTVEWQGEGGGELVCYLEPMLARRSDYFAHPAYSKLPLVSRSHPRGVLFTRRPRAGDRRSALALLWDQTPHGFTTDREAALGRGGLRRLAQALETPCDGFTGAALDPCLLARFPLGEKGKFRLRLALGAGDGEPAALRAAQAALGCGEQGDRRMEGQLRALQLSGHQARRAMELLSALLFSRREKGEFPQSDLWPYGVSGDLPMAAALPPGEGESWDPFPLKAHALLSRLGFPFDLILPLRDGGDYRRPQRTAAMELLKTLHLEGQLGQRGGVHLAELPAEGGMALWESWCAVVLDGEGRWLDRRRAPVQPPALPCALRDEPVSWSADPQGKITLHLMGNLPPVGWSHFLVNSGFGFCTDETGCGHLWQGNPRESPITHWNNDPLAVGGPEWFLLTWAGETHSLFADGDGLPTDVTYAFGWARWERAWPTGKVVATVYVPWDRAERVVAVELPEGEGEIRHITLGQGEEAYPVPQRLCLVTDRAGTRPAAFPDLPGELAKLEGLWRDMVCPLTVETPDPALNRYVNGWCLYQVIACRLLARTSRYQNGGAYGFRDQLQDALSLLDVEPRWAKEQILRCCRRQFTQGDVLHWWHEVAGESDRGVRTRISDDLLWLPYALVRYVEATGDEALLAQVAPYLEAEPLKEGEQERYFLPGTAREEGSVYDHARRAVRCVLDRGTGEHGLLKMGTGDWNDGMDRVGRQGRGESVWLTWFALWVLDRFGPLAERREDRETAELCRAWGEKLRRAAEEAWDGGWYLRGWYDDGAPLGSHVSKACQIDSIAQSWAAFSGGNRAKEGIKSALDRLYDREKGLICLFDPPFDAGLEQPGYIRAYPPGVRENGGQYTHAAAWLALACLEEGMTGDGYAILHDLLPETHPQRVYQAEPYVLPGDVCGVPPHAGRGGWSWYTGAAGWYWQAVTRGLLGLRVREGKLTLTPRLPRSWPGWSARWRGEGWALHISVTRGKDAETLLDGVPVKDIDLSILRGEHRLAVTVCEKNMEGTA